MCWGQTSEGPEIGQWPSPPWVYVVSTLAELSTSNTPTQAGYHSQFSDKVIMLRATKVLCENIRNHLICWYVLNLDVLLLDMRADEVVSDVNVFGPVAISCPACE